MGFNIYCTTWQCWRERSPSSYSLKVQNLSKLEYKSRQFFSGDYKWRMIIYPNGNDKDNGSGFISMYVELDSSSLVSNTQAEVYTDLRFYVFNKKENKYFTIQDEEAKLFNKSRTMQGISQVLPLMIFNDSKNGYIFDEENCEFGVDVIVAPPPTKLEMLSCVKPPCPKFSWSVSRYRNPSNSYTFPVGGKKWIVRLSQMDQDQVYNTSNRKYSICLSLADGEILMEEEKINVDAHLIVEDPRGSNKLKLKLSWYLECEQRSGKELDVSKNVRQFTYVHDKEEIFKVDIEFENVFATRLLFL